MNAQQSTIQRLGSKRVIEQLLMQETFARYFELSGFLSHIHLLVKNIDNVYVVSGKREID